MQLQEPPKERVSFMYAREEVRVVRRSKCVGVLVLASLPILVAAAQLAIFTGESAEYNLFLYLLIVGLCTGRLIKLERVSRRPASCGSLPCVVLLGIIVLRDVVCIGALTLTGVAASTVAITAIGITGSFWGLCLAAIISINEDFFEAIFGKTIGFLYLMGWVAATSVVSLFLISAAMALSGADAMDGWLILVVSNLTTFLLLLTIVQSRGFRTP